MLDTGDRVPNLPMAMTHGAPAALGDFAGRWLVLYFYPKDSTPGCTTEGQQFNALLPRFHALGAEVVGVSRDSLKAHANFRAKQGFAFDLASDAGSALCDAFGVIRQKKLYGREYVGIERSTFLVDPDGIVRKSWRAVKVPGHAQSVLDALEALKAQ